MTPRIRPARLADVDDLLAIERVFSTDRLERPQFRHAVRSATIDLLVAEGADGALGYAMVQLRRNSATAHLSSIAVKPGAAGKGLGKHLLRAAEEAARKEGCSRLRLEVRPENAPAQKLYEKHGYRRTGTIEDYYEDGEEAWGYVKELAAGKTPGKRPLIAGGHRGGAASG
jgi:[ribosomal protein S18]-alanine N-acetyltransferase